MRGRGWMDGWMEEKKSDRPVEVELLFQFQGLVPGVGGPSPL